MYELTKDGLVSLDEKERATAVLSEKLYGGKKAKDIHFLSFDYTFYAMSSLNLYVANHDDILMSREKEIFEELLAKRAVYPIYSPFTNLTLYPLTELNGSGYKIDFENIKKHFKNILMLNDEIYKTKYLAVDFGHCASNADYILILKNLMELLERSRLLKRVFICEIPYPLKELNEMIH